MAPARIDTAYDDAFPCSLTIRIPFPTHRLANTALRAISVDPELSPLVKRTFSLAAPTSEAEAQSGGQVLTDMGTDEHKTVLVTCYAATTNRMLRVAVNGFFESVGVVIAVMRELDVDVVGDDWLGDGDEAIDQLRRVQGLQETGTIG